MYYDDYKASRDLSWQILIDQNIDVLPVRISDICRALGIRLRGYSQSHDLLSSIGLCDVCTETDGFTIGGMIFYNDIDCTIARQRFTVAHELGHILLHHTGDLINREPSPADNPKETAANVFASRLLAPACVLWGCGVTNAEQIAQLSDISLPAAQFRMARLMVLYERDARFKQERGHGCFLMHPLERQVYAQFETYIEDHILRRRNYS